MKNARGKAVLLLWFRLVLGVILVFFGLVGLLACLYGAVTGAVLLAVSALALPLAFKASTKRVWGLALAVLAEVIFLLWSPSPLLKDYVETSKELAARVSREGPASLGVGERTGIYAANVAMALGGLVFGYPEAARETLHLAWPGPEVRTWESDFATSSPKVRLAVKDVLTHAATNGQAVSRVAWSGYEDPNEPKRVTLALNSPMILSAERKPDGSVKMTASARIEYPSGGEVTLFRALGVDLTVQEGLFWALQETGWLFPYTAEWVWTTRTP